MQFRARSVVGFELTPEVLEALGAEAKEAFESWKKDYDTDSFAGFLDETFKLPEFTDVYITKFEYERGGEIQGLEGFEWGKTYCYFREDDTKRKGWKPFVTKLKKKGISFEGAQYSELG